jgi:O-antigen/teichoic acid export membrane protein
VSEPTGVPRRTLGAGATLASLSQIGAALTGGLMGVVIARILGPSGTGHVNLVLTAGLVLGALCSLGVEVGLNYHVSGRRWPAAAALRQSQLAAVVLGVLGAAAGTGIALALKGSAFRGVDVPAIVVGMAALPFMLGWTYSSYAALAMDRYEAYALAAAGQNTVALVLSPVLALPLEVTGAVAAVTISHAVIAVALLRWGSRALGAAPAGWLQETVGRAKEAVSFGLRANVSNVLQLLNYRADLFVLNAVASSADVGRYAVAVSITSLGQLMPRALASVVLPRVAALDTGTERAALDMVVVKSVRHSVLIALGTSVVLALGLLLVPFVYGSDFSEAIVLGLLLLPGIAFVGVGGVLSSTIVGKGKPQYSLYNVLMVTPPTLALYALLIPRFDAVGAALASTASYVAATFITLYFFHRVTGLPLGELRPRAAELADYRDLAARIRTRLRRRASASASE